MVTQGAGGAAVASFWGVSPPWAEPGGKARTVALREQAPRVQLVLAWLWAQAGPSPTEPLPRQAGAEASPSSSSASARRTLWPRALGLLASASGSLVLSLAYLPGAGLAPWVTGLSLSSFKATHSPETERGRGWAGAGGGGGGPVSRDPWGTSDHSGAESFTNKCFVLVLLSSATSLLVERKGAMQDYC